MRANKPPEMQYTGFVKEEVEQHVITRLTACLNFLCPITKIKTTGPV